MIVGDAIEVMKTFAADSFAGAGTTGRAAENLGRECVMIDKRVWA